MDSTNETAANDVPMTEAPAASKEEGLEGLPPLVATGEAAAPAASQQEASGEAPMEEASVEASVEASGEASLDDVLKGLSEPSDLPELPVPELPAPELPELPVPELPLPDVASMLGVEGVETKGSEAGLEAVDRVDAPAFQCVAESVPVKGLAPLDSVQELPEKLSEAALAEAAARAVKPLKTEGASKASKASKGKVELLEGFQAEALASATPALGGTAPKPTSDKKRKHHDALEDEEEALPNLPLFYDQMVEEYGRDFQSKKKRARRVLIEGWVETVKALVEANPRGQLVRKDVAEAEAELHSVKVSEYKHLIAMRQQRINQEAVRRRKREEKEAREAAEAAKKAKEDEEKRARGEAVEEGPGPSGVKKPGGKAAVKKEGSKAAGKKKATVSKSEVKAFDALKNILAPKKAEFVAGLLSEKLEAFKASKPGFNDLDLELKTEEFKTEIEDNIDSLWGPEQERILAVMAGNAQKA